ncbi:MAG TPA: nitroreductase [Chloroflexota bacterium]|nr:nitroreductase [Chloroflexota bacterium]
MFGIIRRYLSIAILAASLMALFRVISGLDADRRRELTITFNKRVLNPLALRTAAYRRSYYGVVRHIGRRSGLPYDTPVVVKLTPEGVVIPLPYGANTDWCRNVVTAGGCTVKFRGEQYTLGSPEIVPASVAEPLVPKINAMLWRRVGITHYLMLRSVKQTAATGAVIADVA